VNEAAVLVAIFVGTVVGIGVHEAVHYAVFRVFGVAASLDRPQLEDGTLVFGVTFPRQESVRARLGALAPLLVGLMLFPVIVRVVVAGVAPVVLGGLVACWAWIVKPSREDLRIGLRS
jgi:fatty acid desaturase